jgi:hypothetical protein
MTLTKLMETAPAYAKDLMLSYLNHEPTKTTDRTANVGKVAAAPEAVVI